MKSLKITEDAIIGLLSGQNVVIASLTKDSAAKSKKRIFNRISSLPDGG